MKDPVNKMNVSEKTVDVTSEEQFQKINSVSVSSDCFLCLLLRFMSMHLCAVCVKVFPEARRELELQVVMNCPVWVLGAELRSSSRAARKPSLQLFPTSCNWLSLLQKTFPKYRPSPENT